MIRWIPNRFQTEGGALTSGFQTEGGAFTPWQVWLSTTANANTITRLMSETAETHSNSDCLGYVFVNTGVDKSRQCSGLQHVRLNR